jgi:hypothetical protein
MTDAVQRKILVYYDLLRVLGEAAAQSVLDLYRA